MSFEIANRLKNLRLQRDISQMDIAKALGMTRQRYSRLESNQSAITFKVIEDIAAYYGISLNEITRMSKEKKSLEVLFRENQLFESADGVVSQIQTILEYMNSHEKLYYRMKAKE